MAEIRRHPMETHAPPRPTGDEREANRRLTAVVEREGDGYVGLCPEVDVAGQGDTVARAHDNLAEALTRFFHIASAGIIDKRPRRPAGSA